jgi:leucyl aminopeptidase
MQLTVTGAAPPGPPVDLIGIIAFEEDLSDPSALTSLLSSLTQDSADAERARERIPAERFKATPGQTLLLDCGARSGAKRLAIVGAGSRSAFDVGRYRDPAAVLARTANNLGARSLLIAEHNSPSDTPSPERLEAIAEGVLLGAYRFEKYLGVAKRATSTLERTIIQVTSSQLRDAWPGVTARAINTARATCYARDLVNEPAGSLTPVALANDIAGRAVKAGLEVTLLGPEQCRERGMGLFLAVAQGSTQEPRFIHLSWRPPNPKGRVVLIGKGVTFDSGGLSLKTNEGMQDMKSDMAGAAAVLASILVAGEEKLPLEIHALAACTENMPSGTAYKLGDVLRSMSGRTVEINNTDAEGRLTLADALTYGLALNPEVVLDFATLTGACVVALGPHTAGVMSNNDATRDSWLAAARRAGEDMWPLPLPPRLMEQLKSEIADLRNTGERWGGALTAGLFLREFIGTTPWVHVDLAGPATTSKEWGCFGKGATGFGVASILEYLRGLAAEPRASVPEAGSPK